MESASSLSAQIEDFANNLKLSGKQPSTIESYCRDASQFFSYLEESNLSSDQVEAEYLYAYKEDLKLKGERPNSIRRSIIGIRQFFRFASTQAKISPSPLDCVVIPPRDERLPISLEVDDIDLLLEFATHIKPLHKARRDSCIISLLAFEGIKASELITLKWSDYINEKGLGSLRIPGARARVIFLSHETSQALYQYKRDYMRMTGQLSDKSLFKKIFISFKGKDFLRPVPQLSRHGLKFILYELGTAINIPKLNTELLRHFAINFQMNLGKSNSEIMKHFGLRQAGNILKHQQIAKSEHNDLRL